MNNNSNCLSRFFLIATLVIVATALISPAFRSFLFPKNKNPQTESFKANKAQRVAADDVSEAEWSAYKKSVEDKINAAWETPQLDNNLMGTVAFNILKDGSIKSVRMKHTSMDANFDKYTIETIEKAAPFRPLPRAYRGESVEFEYTFEYRLQSF